MHLLEPQHLLNQPTSQSINAIVSDVFRLTCGEGPKVISPSVYWRRQIHSRGIDEWLLRVWRAAVTHIKAPASCTPEATEIQGKVAWTLFLFLLNPRFDGWPFRFIEALPSQVRLAVLLQVCTLLEARFGVNNAISNWTPSPATSLFTEPALTTLSMFRLVEEDAIELQLITVRWHTFMALTADTLLRVNRAAKARRFTGLGASALNLLESSIGVSQAIDKLSELPDRGQSFIAELSESEIDALPSDFALYLRDPEAYVPTSKGGDFKHGTV